ncbi:DNA-directed RNA polymerase subunit alpha [Spiroplasma sp. TIUS-1]|uniref:DNA-directed RNA polymerase subunit alpha n=1 Tax=Spiroplasma sp. TIUS-1 TaxID=216963 RepID=UPI001398B136|nr:DNA-directed RNA polymerase subunit alpha [Spiroplasma sp. TIUS-1]QHX36156.1 DNA-directed RNA polymerase subunit alpha [Spiroplasma sp. TIUS-1]
MKPFTRPEYEVIKNDETKNYAEFTLQPLERGFGTTIGNAIRRTLLSSTPGAAVYAIKIAGATHEFTSVNGIVENVSRIVLNIKKLILRIDETMFNQGEIAKLTLKSSTVGAVTGADIECPAGVEVINKDLHIATISDGGVMDMILMAKNSRGYRSFKENKKEKQEVGSITIDSNYTPVLNVSYEVLPTNIGKTQDFEILILKVTTDGSVTPSMAVAVAGKILSEHLSLLVDLNTSATQLEVLGVEDETDEKELDRPIEELDFTQRSLNCLKRANVNTLRDLVEKSEYDIQEIRNLGKKSLKEIKDKVAQLGLLFKSV